MVCIMCMIYYKQMFMSYQDFILKLSEVIDLLYPSKKLRLKTSWKPWIDSETVSAICRIARISFSKGIKNLVWRQTKIIVDWQKWLFRKLYIKEKAILLSRKN